MRFSVKQMLIATAVIAILASILGTSIRGSAIGVGMITGLFALLVILMTQAAVYWLAYVMSLFTTTTKKE